MNNWIEINLPWLFKNCDYPVLKLPNLDDKARKEFGETSDEIES